MKSAKLFLILSDADVLIDFLEVNERVLSTACETIFEIHVLVPVMREVEGLSETRAKKIGLKPFEPTPEQLTASLNGSPRLSFEDNLSLLIAQEQGWILSTNDKALRKECRSLGVKNMWAFDIMLQLNKHGHLSKREAERTAEKIGEINLRITEGVVERFINKLR